MSDEIDLSQFPEIDCERIVFVVRGEGVTYDAAHRVVRFPPGMRPAVQAAIDGYVRAEHAATERNAPPRWAE